MAKILKHKIVAFMSGMGDVFDLRGKPKLVSYYDYFDFPDLPKFSNPDSDALAKDWKVVGLEIGNAAASYQSQK